MEKITKFTFEGVTYDVEFVEEEQLPPGVIAYIYRFVGNNAMDLAVFETSMRTPLQLVKGGDRTVEGHMFGKAVLTVTDSDGTVHTYEVDDDTPGDFMVEVAVGQTMRWVVIEGIFQGWEVCFPPWKPGRYEDLEY